MIKAVFLDWYNTVACYDPPREELHSNLLREFGINASPRDLIPGLLAADKFFYAESIRTPVQKMSPEEQARFYLRYGEILFEKAKLDIGKDLFLQIVKRWPELQKKMHFVLFEDVITTVQMLKGRKLVIGLLTNATKRAVSVLEQLGLQQYLDFIVTSEEAGTEKPDKRIFMLALEKAGVKAAEAIHVGDQYEIDIAGARGAGIGAVMIDRFDLYPEVKDCPRIHGLNEVAAYL